MGRKRRGQGKASSIRGARVNSLFILDEDEYVPLVNSPQPQVLLDHEIDKAIAHAEAERAQLARLKEAGFTPYQTAKYKDQSINIIDVNNGMAVIEYFGRQYQVKLSDLNV